MKKIFFVILVLFIFTGCDAKYNLEIYNDKVIESSNFLLDKTDKNEMLLDNYYSTNYLAYYDMKSMKDNMYNKDKIYSNKKIGMNLNYIYFSDQYQNSSLLDRCYYKKSFIRNKEHIILYTEGGASCFYKDEEKLLDSLEIKIKTDLEVLDNNADEHKDNYYIWKLNENNFSKKDIFIKIKRGSKVNYAILAILIIILCVIGFVLIRIKIVNGKKNEI